ncbi:MAG: glycosyltransferase [Bacilli bacterium]|nr:glycosyltransferase [Bacilli bacterium]
MKKEILVSIVVPVYNAKDYLEACLNSIINQSYKNLEIILIDDGSNDGSGNILDSYAKKDNRIRVVHNTNYGVSYARNYGIKIATGSKILFIDSDDTVDLDYVKKLLIPLEIADYNLVICGINDVKLKNNRIRPRKFPKKLTGKLQNDFCDLFMMPIITGPVTKLYDTSILRKNEIYFSEDISFNEDVMFNLQYLRYVENYKIVKEALYNYLRRPSQSLSKNRSEKNFQSVLKVANALKNFIEDKKIIDGNIALTHQCLNYLKWFAVTDGGYPVFKQRASKLKSVLDGMYATKDNKRATNIWLLKNGWLFVLYVMYWIREKGKL